MDNSAFIGQCRLGSKLGSFVVGGLHSWARGLWLGMRVGVGVYLKNNKWFSYFLIFNSAL